MKEPPDNEASPKRGREQFAETRWSIVLTAGRGSSPHADAALETLCQTYWYPIYAYIRRRGYAPVDAEDSTQEFFLRVIRDHSFARADRAKGRFRGYLLAAVNHFLADAWDRSQTLKRGGGEKILSLEQEGQEGPEQRYLQELASDATPEKLYDQRWAAILLEQGLKRLRAEFRAAGQEQRFERLKPFLTEDAPPGVYDELAAELGVHTGSVAVIIHRFRQRYGRAVRAELAETVSDPAQFDLELRHLFAS